MKYCWKTKFFTHAFRLVSLTFLTFVLLAPAFLRTETMKASADTGPKPSVHVTFENMGDELCYGTLLSKTPSTGPARAWDGTEGGKFYEGADEAVWRAFTEFKDEDGFYFLQWFWRTDENKALNWTYYPPQTFKILLYYPDRATKSGAADNSAGGATRDSETTAASGAFCVSDVLERYAFHSYYFVDMRNVQSETIGTIAKISATQGYDYSAEILGFFVRFIITLGVETLLALAFGLRTKRAFLTVLAANGATQVALNILLNVQMHFNNVYGVFPLYFFAELFVFVAEAALYCFILGKRKNGGVSGSADENGGKTAIVYSKKRLILYAFTANLVSFCIGLPLAILLPAVF